MIAESDRKIIEIMQELGISSFAIRTHLVDGPDLDTELMLTFRDMYQDIPDSPFKMHHVPEIAVQACSDPRLELLEKLIFGEVLPS